MKKNYFFTAIIIACLAFSSCSINKKQTVFLSDRHGLSYELVKDYSEQKGPVTLVLLDYHNDVQADSNIIRSSNWVGQLIQKKYVNKVLWISGRNLHEMNRQARMAWLNRNLKNKFPDTAQLILDTIELCDFNELILKKLPDSTVITFDFDILTKDPGPDPDIFVIEAADWIKKQKCELVTLSFSAVYENNPEKAWTWLSSFITHYDKKADWYFASGIFNEKPEGLEDQAAWNEWKKHPELFNQFEYSFYRGAHLWLNAPFEIQNLLLKKNIKPIFQNDSISAKIITAWKNPELQTLHNEYTYDVMKYYAQIAVKALKESINGKIFQPTDSSYDLLLKDNTGVAVRFKTTEKDRGCFTLYSGVSNLRKAVEFCAYEASKDPRYSDITEDELNNLFVNITFFSDWKKMKTPYDFICGAESLIVDNPKAVTKDAERTLLQNAIAAEKTLDEDGFLERLLLKAGLNKDCITDDDLEFYKSPSVFFTAKVSELL